MIRAIYLASNLRKAATMSPSAAASVLYGLADALDPNNRQGTKEQWLDVETGAPLE